MCDHEFWVILRVNSFLLALIRVFNRADEDHFRFIWELKTIFTFNLTLNTRESQPLVVPERSLVVRLHFFHFIYLRLCPKPSVPVYYTNVSPGT